MKPKLPRTKKIPIGNREFLVARLVESPEHLDEDEHFYRESKTYVWEGSLRIK